MSFYPLWHTTSYWEPFPMMCLSGEIPLYTTLQWRNMSVIASQREHQSSALLALCVGNPPVICEFPLQNAVMQKASLCHDIIISSQKFHQTSHSTLQWVPYTWPWPLHTVQDRDKEKVVVWQPAGGTNQPPLRLMNLWGCERQICERMEVLVVKHCKSITQHSKWCDFA